MCRELDEKILYEGYLKLSKEAEKNAEKRGKGNAENDKKLLDAINSKASLLLTYLDEINILTAEGLLKKIVKAKGNYMQFFYVKGRNPQLIKDKMKNRMDRLIRAVARHEADILYDVRQQETNGESIDLLKLFEDKKYRTCLINSSIRTIVRNALKEMPLFEEKLEEVTSAIETTYDNSKLVVCNNAAINAQINNRAENTVTAFVDESIRPVELVDGEKIGSYSYIICKGHLKSEKEIDDAQIIAQGVDYLQENNHIELLTEAAIGKVMMTLAYDFNFNGNVQIFTDNLSVMKEWDTISKNSRLAKLFESVRVTHISRKKNTRADKLGRSYTYLRMPTNTYKEIASKVRVYDRIQEQKAEKIQGKDVLGKIVLFFRNMFTVERLDAC